jgi:hypothetical protein
MYFNECITGLLLGGTYVRHVPNTINDASVFMRMVDGQLKFKCEVSDYEWDALSLYEEDLIAVWEPVLDLKQVPNETEVNE